MTLHDLVKLKFVFLRNF